MKEPISTGNLIRDAELRAEEAAIDLVRREPLPDSVVITGLRAMITSKLWWLDTFSGGPKKRPDNEIQARRRELAILVQARDKLLVRGASSERPP